MDFGPLIELVEQHRRFLITSHVRPDGDAIGSEIAMARLLEHHGRQVRIVNPSTTPPRLQFLDPRRRVEKIRQDVSVDEAADTDVVLILDTSSWQQLVDMADVLRRTEAPRVVIDHHVSADDLGAIEFKDTTAPATGLLVFRLATCWNVPIDAEIATALYTAIATDTGWFRFSSTTPEAVRAAAALMESGAQPHGIYRELYEQNSVERVRLAGRVLGRVQLACDGRLAYLHAGARDFAATGAVPADTEDLVNECLTIAGTEAAFICVELPNRRVKVSFRSRTDLDVAKVAEQFGGGGHRQAAGATLPGPLANAVVRVLEAMTTALERHTA